MQFDVWSKGLPTLEVEALVLGVFDDGELADEARAVDSASGGRLKAAAARGDISGRIGDTLLLVDVPGIKAGRVLLAGVGARKDLNRKHWKRALDAAVLAVTRTRIASIAIA